MSEYKDPYKVIGVKSDATDDEIKKAYRDLARKYHPDRYTDSDLKAEAEEKMKEVNSAYEEIQDIRSGKKQYGPNNGQGYGSQGYGSQGYGSQGYGGYNTGYGNNTYTGRFANVRRNINEGNIDEAENELNNTHEGDRTAEWHFLMGCVHVKRGRYVDANREIDRACKMDPYNREYQIVRAELRRKASTGNEETISRTPGCLCTICQTLMCVNLCCSCMRG